MTLYSHERTIEVDGTAWAIRVVRNNGYVWGVAYRPGEEAQAYDSDQQIDLGACGDIEGDLYDEQDEEVLDVIEELAPAQIKAG